MLAALVPKFLFPQEPFQTTESNLTIFRVFLFGLCQNLLPCSIERKSRAQNENTIWSLKKSNPAVVVAHLSLSRKKPFQRISRKFIVSKMLLR
jgi:hypothetical protein